MSLRTLVYLTCTNCNDQFHSETGHHYAESGREILGRARSEGWTRRKVANGSMWDFCPRCFQRHVAESHL